MRSENQGAAHPDDFYGGYHSRKSMQHASNEARIAQVLGYLEEHIRAADYRGWDPFDGLNSRLFRAAALNRIAIFRLAWIQLFKRSPINFRRLALVPTTANPKALALISMGYGKCGDTTRQTNLVQQLLSMRGPEGGWGYPFDWQARAFFVPKGTPNVICTAYATQALVAHQERTGTDHRPAIEEAARFVAAELVRTAPRGDKFVAYIPTTNALVHNASLWGSYILAVADPARYGGLAHNIVNTSITAQTKNGAWPYGDRGHHQFVDSFHTGFNLQALELLDHLMPSAALEPTIERGLRYYERTFFDRDGRPRYFSETPWPLDCHSAAQACLTLLSRRANARRERLAIDILIWTLANMWHDKRKAFFYQKTRYFTNRIDYLRWTQAWMFLALAHASHFLTSKKKYRSEAEHHENLPIAPAHTPSVA